MSWIFDCFARTDTRDNSDDPPPPPPRPPPPKLSYETLMKQDASTTSTIIQIFESDKLFAEVGTAEANAIIQRDHEDDEKLAAGIQISIDKGVLDPLGSEGFAAVPTYKTIDVIGKSPEAVADIILKDMGEAATKGGLMVLCGLSGTGKGTTVAALKVKLQKAVTWSNGNVFRAMTLLAVTWCELFNLEDFDASQALSESNVARFTNMLSFAKKLPSDSWDIKVKGLGLDFWVGDVANTLLKDPKIGKHIPTVAQQIQGEVVTFAANALRQMVEDRFVVLLEGRQQTVDYVPTPFRYTLIMSDTTVLGQRRAAQRLAANLLEKLPELLTKIDNEEGEQEGMDVTDEAKDSQSKDTENRTKSNVSEKLINDALSMMLDAMAYEVGIEVPLEKELKITLSLWCPMGITVREVEGVNENNSDEGEGDGPLALLVTGVEPSGQALEKGARIGYYLTALDGIYVSTLDEIFEVLNRLKSAKGESRQSFELTLTKNPPTTQQPSSEVYDEGIDMPIESPRAFELRGVSAGDMRGTEKEVRDVANVVEEGDENAKFVENEKGSGDEEDSDEDYFDENMPPEDFLNKVGLGHYVASFQHFGVESVQDIVKTFELLGDQELKDEIGMEDNDIQHFRSLFPDEDEFDDL